KTRKPELRFWLLLLKRVGCFAATIESCNLSVSPLAVRNSVTLKSGFVSLLLLLLFTLSAPSHSQRQSPPPVGGDLSGAPPGEDEARDELTRNMAKKVNEERHVALKNDTDKLLKLAVELKAYVE